MFSEKLMKKTFDKMNNVLAYYLPYLYTPVQGLSEVSARRTEEHFRTPPTEGLSPIHPGEKWGGEFQNIWLTATVTVPPEAEGKQLYLIPDAEMVEALLFVNDVPAGLVNSKNDFLGGRHIAAPITTCAHAGEVFRVAFECYSGHYCVGCFPYDQYGKDSQPTLEETRNCRTYHGLRLCVLNETINRMLFDLSTVYQLADLSDKTDFIVGRACRALEDAFPYLILDPVHHSPEELDASARQVCERLAPVLAKAPGDGCRGYVGIIGHSHMDTAWLWPMSETIRKCARTYAEAISLMERYPNYNFIQSSALHLSWMKEYYPALYEKIREKIKEGRYDPTGGVWVECDCNITGGEAMIRQFLYGQKFTREEFGYTASSFWLPDTFGYSASTPQIMLGCDVRYFFTTKISWNELNPFPADTFRWRGIDGSEVLTHFNLSHCFPDPQTITQALGNLADPSHTDSRLISYGFGDGGGGPTSGMLEYVDRIMGMPGLPTVETTTPGRFMEERVEPLRDRLSVYDGELYLEFHRGTLTSMHNIKRNNRLAEIALHDMECIAALSGAGAPPETERLWKTLLQNQFHDILPGSSMREVNDRAEEEVSALIAEAKEISRRLLSSMLTPAPDCLTLTNTLSFARKSSDSLVLDGELSFTDAAAQTYTDPAGRKKTAVSGIAIPALGSATLHKGVSAPAPSHFRMDGARLTTPLYEAVFDENGYIASLYDRRANRPVGRSGGAPLGVLLCGEDMPSAYENWELESDFARKLSPCPRIEGPVLVSDGAVEFRIRNTYRIGAASSAVVDTVFYADSPEIGYEMQLDWQEKRQLLKVGFDLNIRCRTLRSEIQYGNAERPVTRNNDWENARYEVVNHKWSDLSEPGYGVALLNDCKYGISAEGGNLMLSLHRGGLRPDYRGDAGVHEMRYALLPHIGAFTADGVVLPAYCFNYGVITSDGFAAEKPQPSYPISADNILCETIKPAEDGSGAVVLRLYECEGSYTAATVGVGACTDVLETNMLEEPIAPLAVQSGAVSLTFRPFEIKTIYLRP